MPQQQLVIIAFNRMITSKKKASSKSKPSGDVQKMTKQSRLDRFISSIFSTHIDPENSEVLENKKDTENNVDKILHLITEEESSTSSLNSVDKSELVSLINDVHRGYKELYKRYDNLTENLKKKFHHNEHHGQFSSHSSSDSDSSDSASEEKSSKRTSKKDLKEELKISLEKCKELQEQLETVNKKNYELHTDVTSLRAKISPLETIEAKLEEVEATKVVLENNLRSLTKSTEFLQDENRELKERLATSLKGGEEANKRIYSIEEQNQALSSDNSDALSKAIEFAEGCKIEIQQMKDQMLTVQSNNTHLKEALEKSTQEVASLNQLVDNKNKEVEALRSKNFESKTKIQELEKLLTDQRDGYTLNMKLVSDEFSSKIAQLLLDNESVNGDLEAAKGKSSDLSKALAEMSCETSRILAEVREENGALKSNLLASSSQMQDMEKTISTLKFSIEKSKDENSNMLNKIQELEKSLTAQRDEATLSLKLANDEFSSKYAKLLSEKEILKLDVEAASRKNSELSRNLAEAQEENDALKSDILKWSHQSQDKDNIVSDLERSSRILQGDNSNLLCVIDDLNKQLKDKEEKEKNLGSELGEAVKMTQEEREKVNKFSMQLEEVRNKNFEVYEALRSQFEATMQESIKLKQVLEALTDEKSCVRSENQELMCRLKLADTEMENYKAHIEQLETDVSKLHAKIENSSLQLNATKLQLTQINKELGSAAGQMEKLALENSRLVSELESKNTLCKELENELGQLKDENSVLRKTKNELQEAEKVISDLESEIEQLTGYNGRLHVKVDDLGHELEIANHQISELNKQIRFSREEISDLITRLEYVEADSRTQGNNLDLLSQENSMLQQNNKDLDARNSDLEEELQTKSAELSTLHNDFDEARNEATVQIQALILQVNGLEAGLRLLKQEKSELEIQMKTMGDIFLENQVLVTKLEDEITSKISRQEGRIQIQKNKSCGLLKDLRQLNEHLQTSREKLDIARSAGEKQIKEINKLSSIQKELTKKLKLSETEKTHASKEIGRLQSEVEAGEVHLRLANQLLHITVGENKVKEEILQERGREMQETIQKLSEKLELLQKEPSRIKEVVESGISGFWPELDKIDIYFKKKHSQLERGLSICINELDTLKAKLREQLYVKQEMNEEIYKLTSTLKTSEESISILRSEAEDLRFQLARKNTETEELTGRSFEWDERLQRVEKTVKEQAEELLIRNEEKREAIRQLCLQIDYYRNKCSQLYQHLLATQNQSTS